MHEDLLRSHNWNFSCIATVISACKLLHLVLFCSVLFVVSEAFVTIDCAADIRQKPTTTVLSPEW